MTSPMTPVNPSDIIQNHHSLEIKVGLYSQNWGILGYLITKTFLNFTFELFSLRIKPDDVECGDITGDRGGGGKGLRK